MNQGTDPTPSTPAIVEDATFYRPVEPHFILAALIGYKVAGRVPSVDEDEAGFFDKIGIVQDTFDAWLAQQGITDHCYAKHTEPAIDRFELYVETRLPGGFDAVHAADFTIDEATVRTIATAPVIRCGNQFSFLIFNE